MMRILTFTGVLLLIMGFGPSQGQIAFQKISLSQAQEVARAENKMVFVDFRADWCKPCLAMEKYTFTDPQVAAAINANFIAIKADVDYFEAMDWQEMYNVSVLPTILIINPNGEVQRRIMGEKTPAKLMNELEFEYFEGGGEPIEVVKPPKNKKPKKDKKQCFLTRWFNSIKRS